MKIYLTRHGETEWNKAGKMQGWNNSNLTEKGSSNAKKLGESLKNIDFDCVYCSPLGRALDTAKHILGDKRTEIKVKEALKEMGFGCWEGVEHNILTELYPEQQYNLWNKPHLYQPVDGESYDELIRRVSAFLDEITQSPSVGNILIVTHAAVIKAIYSIMKNIAIEEFWGPPYIHDTCLTVMDIQDGEIRWVLEADTSHLD